MAPKIVNYDEKILAKKIADSKGIIREAFQRYPSDGLAIAWTGGKDSTLTLWLIRQVCLEDGIDVPQCFTIDEGDMFPEVQEFLERHAEAWDLDLKFIHNDDVSEAAGGELGAMVKVSDLNERNQREVRRLGYEEDEFPYEPESYVGNHLMKTVVLNTYLEENDIQAFFSGIRWDEQIARLEETYFSPRPATEYSPEHDRISPLLHFTERDVWNAIHTYGLPFCKLYAEGYRSLGARVTTTAADEIP
ncbi:MAG: phosphoadenosine phosphosulfate reductase family protein, partial [Anaerolineae bacterium]